MKNILDKTTFSEEYITFIEFRAEDTVVIVNPQTVNWVTLTIDEYSLYKQRFSDQEKSLPIIMKFIVNNIIRFKNNIHEPSPVSTTTNVYFAPTPNCNLHCVYCYAKAELPNTAPTIFNDTQFTKRLFDNIFTANIDTVFFTGGEPMLRKDLFDMVKYIQSKGVKTSILTNGTLVNDTNVEFFKLFDSVKISLDGSTSTVNDKTRGFGSFDKIVSSIRFLKNNGIDVSVASVISKANIESVKDLLNFVQNDLGVKKHSLALYVSHGRGKENADSMECTYDEYIKFHSEYVSYLIMNNDIEKITSIFQPRIKKNTIRQLCGAGSSETFIDNTGNVYPCRLFETDDKILGNVFTTPLIEILSNEQTKDTKNQLMADSIQSCQKCGYKNICGGGCRSTHACYTGDASISCENICNIIKNDIRSSILLDSGINPITLKRFEVKNVRSI